METTKITIEEQENGWLLTWDKGCSEHYPTAAEALDAVKERGEMLSEAGYTTTQIIEWISYTTIGKAIVTVLQ